MNARIVAFVASRLFAVYLLVTYGLSMTVQAVGTFLLGQGGGIAYAGASVIITSLYVLAAAGLWTGASWIARHVSKPFPEKLEADMSYEHWQSFVFLAVGLFALFMTCQVFAQLLKAMAVDGFSYDESAASTIKGGLIYLLFALVLLLLPQTLVRGLNALRAWGNKPIIEADEE